MSKQRKSRTPIITDDEATEAEELNPFSFKEFLRWKNFDQEEEEEEEEEELAQGEQEEQIQEEQEEQIQEEEESRRGAVAGGAAAGGAAAGGGATAGGTEGGAEDRNNKFSITEVDASCRGCSNSELKEENAALRRSVSELRRSVAASERRVSQLTEELLQSRRKEEKEAQDLEGMVQSVEHNLGLMTRRAVKAEHFVSKLKFDLQQLQAELVCVRSENERLKAAESQVVMTMRQNAQLASEYLKKTTGHAHSSIQKLLAEAESLRLVSELLSSIDKISTIDTDS